MPRFARAEGYSNLQLAALKSYGEIIIKNKLLRYMSTLNGRAKCAISAIIICNLIDTMLQQVIILPSCVHIVFLISAGSATKAA